MSELPRHKEAERSVLALIAVSGEVELLNSLEPKDFADDGHEFLFSELRMIHEQGQPLGDPPTLTHWLKSKPARKRALEAIKEKELHLYALDVFSEYATIAHKDFYLKELRKARLQRMQMFVALEWRKKVAAEDPPLEVLNWAQGAFNQIWEKAYEVMPGEVAVE